MRVMHSPVKKKKITVIQKNKSLNKEKDNHDNLEIRIPHK